MKCKLCKRESRKDSNLCAYHASARETLRAKYGAWKEAYGSLSWEEYLNRIKRHGETGQWVREVVTLESGEES